VGDVRDSKGEDAKAMRGFDDQTSRLYQRVVGLRGMNSASPARSLPDGESPSLSGVLLSTGNIVPGKVGGDAAFTNPNPVWDEPIRLAFVGEFTTPYIILMGDTKCWVQTSGAPVAKTPGTPFTTSSPPMWDGFTMLHDGAPVAVVNNRGVNRPHYWDGDAGVFLPLSSAPSMRCCVGYLGRLVGGSVTPASDELLNRLQFSLYGDITTWSGATAGDHDLVDEGDRILRLALLRGHQLLILRQETTYIGYPTTVPGDPIATQFLSNWGIFARQSLQPIGNSYIFMGGDDIYIADATAVVPVGWKIRRHLFRDATPSTLDQAWSFTDKRAKNYYLVVAMSDGTQMAWIYNWEEQAWTQQDLTGYTMLGTWRKD